MAPKKSSAPSTPATTPSAAEIKKIRARLGIPVDGQPLRAWIRYQLQNRINPATSRAWTQADIARECFASEPTVSVIYTGRRLSAAGRKSERIRSLTAQVLGIPEAAIWLKTNADNADDGSR